MKSLKGHPIGKVPPGSMEQLLAETKDRLDRMKFLLNFFHGGKWDPSMGAWAISIPAENLRGWMMVEYVVSSSEDFSEACKLYDRAVEYSKSNKGETL